MGIRLNVLGIFYRALFSFCLCSSFRILYSSLTDVVSILSLHHFVSAPLCFSVSYALLFFLSLRLILRLSSLFKLVRLVTLPPSFSFLTKTFKFPSASSCLSARHVFDVIL